MNSACDKIEHLLSMRIDTEPLSRAHEQRLQNHLAACKKCRQKFAELMTIDKNIKKALTQKFQAHIGTELLGQWLAQEQMDEVDRWYIRSHLKTCSHCQTRLQWLRDMESKKSDFQIDTHPVPQTKPKNFMQIVKATIHRFYDSIKSLDYLRDPRRVMTAAVIVCLLFVISLLRERVSKQEGEFITDTEIKQLPDQKATDENRATQGAKEDLLKRESALAANFQPLPYMEEMVQSRFRSQEIQVSGPATNAVLKPSEKIEFRWKPPEPELTLKIINNRGEAVQSVTTRDGTILPLRLAPGLYYWKLENEHDLLFVGKFFVRD